MWACAMAASCGLLLTLPILHGIGSDCCRERGSVVLEAVCAMAFDLGTIAHQTRSSAELVVPDLMPIKAHGILTR